MPHDRTNHNSEGFRSLRQPSHLSSSKAGAHSLVPLHEGLGMLGIVLQAQVVQAPLQVLWPQPCSFQAAALPAQQAHKACNTHCRHQEAGVPDGMRGSEVRPSRGAVQWGKCRA